MNTATRERHTTGRPETERPPTAASCKSVTDVLLLSAGSHPNKTALIFDGKTINYADLAGHCAAIAAQLKELGLTRGDRVGLLFPNHPDYVAAFFAVAATGGTVVPINPLLKSEEITHILEDSGSRFLIVHTDCLKEALASVATSRNPITILAGGCDLPTMAFDGHDTTPFVTIAPLTQSRHDYNSMHRVADVDPHTELALLVYTSGTTGKPKGAMLTHKNVLSVFPDRLDIIDLQESDRTLAVLPMCHIYGITVLMIGTISRAATLVVLPKFDAAGALSVIQEHGVTVVPAVPAMHRFMIMELAKTSFDTSSVRLAMSGGSALDPELIPEIHSHFPNSIVLEGYALTETACAATLNPLKGKRKPGSVGPALKGIDIEIRNTEGTSLPSGSENVGELFVRGANVMTGYFNLPEATAEVLSNGWFATGDLAWQDDDGYIYIVGRKKEMIIRGGQNIYPREIEDVIIRMPGVADVAVVGVPDKLMGERVKAIVVRKAGHDITEDSVKSFCADRLAEYKVPRLVEFIDVLPRNSTGKILKRLLLTGKESESNLR